MQKKDPAPVPALAKITAPRLRNVYERERLFQLLDQVADRSLIWLSAPAGFGKTTVVASWLHAHEVSAIWYQCDEGDADIASFFHFLTLAAQSLLQRQQSLPHLSPELYPALTTFVRNYFRELCSLLIAPTFIVFDNWQDIPDDAVLRELLPVAVNELPSGISLIVISREAPPANFSRLQSAEQMVVLSWQELQLTAQETADIAARYEPMVGQQSVLTAQQLYEATQGWAAGLAVMLRHETDVTAPHWDATRGSNQAIFNYLASEIFERQDESTKLLLMKTAYLESITIPVAQRLTGNAAAKDILDNLVRRNVFTLHRPTSGTYHFHPLFKHFLRTSAASTFSVVEQQELLHIAARILVEQQDTEAAIDLLLQAGSWEQAAQLILSVAPTVIQQNRFKTLADWITSLPESQRVNHAWLTYWQGCCLVAIDFPAALGTLESAHALFAADGDTLGQMLTTSDIVQYLQMGFAGYESIGNWIPVFESLLSEQPVFPSPQVEARVLAGFIIAVSVVQPNHPMLQRCLDRTWQLQTQIADVHIKCSVAIAHFNHNLWLMDIGISRRIMIMAEPLIECMELGPAVRANLLWVYASHAHLVGDAAVAHKCLNRALEFTRHNGLPFVEGGVLLCRLQILDYRCYRDELYAGFARLESLLASIPPILRAHSLWVRAMFHLSQGELSLARELAEHSLVSQSWGLPQVAVTLGLGEIFCEMGLLPAATKQLDVARRMIADIAGEGLFQFVATILAAELARREKNFDRFTAELSRAFAIGRKQGYASYFHGYPIFLFRLLPYAFELGIEVEYCCWLIKKQNIAPPSRDIEHWPWPIKIYTLGQFKVVVDDVPLEFNGKVQRKPLELLKALLASNDGVDAGALAERLWPDLDGDAARNALGLALHRLRKMLKRKDAVTLDQGRVLLNAACVWVDANALELLCERAHQANHDDVPAEVRRLLNLYHGHFLVDQEQPWSFAARERLRSKFIRYVGVLSGLLHEQQRWDELTVLYRRAIELDPLAEEFHRGLMQSLSAQGRGAEAAAVYCRCKETFARLSGIEPSAPTQALYARLLQA